MNNNFRPPAVPLVTVDPYFSVWSCSNVLYDDYTRHWTGKPNSLTGLILIDGVTWRFAGVTALNKEVYPFYFTRREPDGMEQVSVEVKALSTEYVFKAGGIRLKVDFTTPLLMDDIDVLSRPVSYVSFEVASIDSEKHDVKIYMDITGEWCIDDPKCAEQNVLGGRKKLGDNVEAMHLGAAKQNILGKSGDNRRIDWGYVYLVIPNNRNKKGYVNTSKIRNEFINNEEITSDDIIGNPRRVDDDMLVASAIIDFNSVDEQTVSDFLIIAYDDIYSMEYFNDKLLAYWRRNGMTFDEMLLKSIEDYESLMEKCKIFNEKVYKDGIKSGGNKYADVLSLAYRQAIAAHKLVVDKNNDVLFISKECFSNGCAATVDVSYPSMPLFLLYNTELVKGMLRPIFKYAKSEEWCYEFAPHDVGVYPKLNGQAYSMKKDWIKKENINGDKNVVYGVLKEESLKNQMPVEECGNMLIIATAVAMVDKDVKFASENWDLLSQWADYLVHMGFDPGEQLCSDDFTGHLAHNANLSIKAILGIASYSILCRMMGYEKKAEEYIKIARELADKWEEIAREDDHYKLTFIGDNTWSLKYNMIWDDIFHLNIFSDEIKDKEIVYYIDKINKYGTPLDSRSTFTKPDWLVWAATLSKDDNDFTKLIEPIWSFLNETPSRVPFSDWYGTVDRLEKGFHNRSVVGGVFIKLLKDFDICKL